MNYLEEKYNKEFIKVEPADRETVVSNYYVPKDDPKQQFMASYYRDSDNNFTEFSDGYMFWVLQDDLNEYARSLCADVYPNLTHEIYVTGIGEDNKLDADTTIEDYLEMPRTLSLSESIYIVVAIQADNGISEQDFYEGVDKLEQIWQQESAKHNFSICMTICAATSHIYDQFDEYTVASDPSLTHIVTATNDILKYGYLYTTDEKDGDKWDPHRKRLQYYYMSVIRPDDIDDRTPPKYKDR